MMFYRSALFFAFFISMQPTFCQDLQWAETDSLGNIKWQIGPVKAFLLDDQGNAIGFSDYEKWEFDTNPKADAVVVLTCNKKESVMTAYNNREIYEKFMFMQKVDESMNIVTFGSEMPDSIETVDSQALEKYYDDNKASLTIDTLLVSNTRNLYNQYYVSKKCSYRNAKKDGIEIGYYTIKELRGKCIGKNWMMRYKGNWKAGEKHGKWIEYDKTGNVASIKKYKHGKLIRERLLH